MNRGTFDYNTCVMIGKHFFNVKFFVAAVLNGVITCNSYIRTAHIEHSHLLGNSIGNIRHYFFLRPCRVEALYVVNAPAYGYAHLIIGFNALRKNLYVVELGKLYNSRQEVLFFNVCVDIGNQRAVDLKYIRLKAENCRGI